MRYVARTPSGTVAVEVSRKGLGRYSVRIDGRDREVVVRRDGPSMMLALDDRTLEAVIAREGASDGPAGELHTGFLEEHPGLLTPGADPWLDEIAVVAAAVAHFRRQELTVQAPDAVRGRSAWKWSARDGEWGR